MNRAPTVGVVGAGPAGLAALSCLQDYDLSKECFNQNGTGGLWGDKKGGEQILPSNLTSNISKHNMIYPGFAHAPDTPLFLTVSDANKYLKSFAQSKNLNSDIHNGCSVVHLDIRDDGRWTMKFCDDGKVYSETFSNIVIATGFFNKPFLPSLNLDDYKGVLIHSSQYKNPELFLGKKVAVVGGGFSGVDIASDLANKDVEVIHVCNKVPIFLNRIIKINDKMLPLDIALYQRTQKNNFSVNSVDQKNRARNSFLISLSDQNSVENLRLDPNSTDFLPVAISDDYVKLHKQSLITLIKNPISSLNINGISFADGEKKEVDAIILATGYQFSLSFLSDKCKRLLNFNPSHSLQPITAFKTIYNSELSGLYFVGAYKGSYWSHLYLQSRLVSALISGSLEITKKAYEEGIQESESLRKLSSKEQQLTFPNYIAECDFLGQMTNDFPFNSDYVDSFPFSPHQYGLNNSKLSEVCKEEIIDLRNHYL
jgi:dimethylaniline monooxygenase (N-oxide forming)